MSKSSVFPTEHIPSVFPIVKIPSVFPKANVPSVFPQVGNPMNNDKELEQISPASNTTKNLPQTGVKK